MSPFVWVIVGVLVVVAIIAIKASTPKVAKAVAEAMEEGDIAPIVAAIEELRPSSRTAAYNHAIRQLWDGYERGLAITLVMELAERHKDSLIAQYWIKNVMQVEPKLASERFSKEFLKSNYRPELAAQCGPVG